LYIIFQYYVAHIYLQGHILTPLALSVRNLVTYLKTVQIMIMGSIPMEDAV